MMLTSLYLGISTLGYVGIAIGAIIIIIAACLYVDKKMSGFLGRRRR
jgi:hypothetical protein